jgi:uncharacterized protein
LQTGVDVLVDAGPLVAILDRSDAHHEACTRVLAAASAPMLTVWPAFTEAMYLLGFDWRGQDALWKLLDAKAVSLAQLDTTDAPRMRELMAKYRDLPMDLADAAIVRVAEREGIRKVFTIDRKDFGVYRPKRIRKFTIVP